MRGRRLLTVLGMTGMLLAGAPAAMASGGVNSGGVNSGGGGGGGGGAVTAPCATLSASGTTVNQSGVLSVRVSGTVTSCSDVDETLYVQIQDGSGRLGTTTLTPPNTAGGACYICDSVLAARKSWSFSMQRTVAADGTTYPFTVNVLHRDSLSSDPVLLATQLVSVTVPTTRNS
jgi:hypothetical protein